MTESETQLLDLLIRRSFRRGEFRLASGDTSSYYIDGKMTEVCSEGAFLIGEVIYEQTHALNIDAIGGLETGAIPLTTAAVLSYHLHGKPMEGFWVRDKIKEHGTQKFIEGNLTPGARVVIVEDVVTKGTSAVKAIEAVRKVGCEVVLVLALVDRQRGAEALFREHGITCYQPIFSLRDFGVET
ncbi:MAG TPA: orotate phosphoribosyltransferase [Gemmataceae bacterium]|nr:orotate phosphoribosyltransferase [Gemmataceae bacterium]